MMCTACYREDFSKRIETFLCQPFGKPLASELKNRMRDFSVVISRSWHAQIISKTKLIAKLNFQVLNIDSLKIAANSVLISFISVIPQGCKYLSEYLF